MLRQRRTTDFLERAVRQAPELAHFRLGLEHAYLVGTPELVRELFGPLGRVTAKGRGLEQARRLLGEGLLTSEGELHRRQRRLVQPAFHAGRVGRTRRRCAPRRPRCRPAQAGPTARSGTSPRHGRSDAAHPRAHPVRHRPGRDSPAVAGALAELLGRFPRVMLPGGPLLNRLPLPSTRRLRPRSRSSTGWSTG